MNLSHDQKKYIKKNIRLLSISQISRNLKINEEILSDYIKKRWGEGKLKKVVRETSVVENKNSKHWFQKGIFPIIFLVILILITYANALDNAFLSDDIAEIVQNPKLGEFGYIFRNLAGILRPLIYWIAFHISNFFPHFPYEPLNPLIFRIPNILLHIGSTILIFFILLKIYKKRFVSFAAAAIFAIHPAIAEPVIWISGGMYTQYTFFFLLSFLFYIKSSEKKKYYIFSIFSYLLSFLSHPVMPASLFLIYPLYEFTFGKFGKNWVKVIPYLTLTIVYVVINLLDLSERTTTLQTVHYQERGVDNMFILVPIAITSYFELIFWPKILTLYHSELLFSGISFIVRLFLTALYFITIVVAFFKNKSVFFWLLFFFLALAPTLTPFRLNWIVAERYLYLPSIGIFTLIAIGLDRLGNLKKGLKPILYGLLIIVIIALQIRTIVRNIDWHNQDNLWIAASKTSPSSPNNHNNLGDMYGRWGNKQKAIEEFQTAIALKPNYGDAYHNLANVYRELGQIDKALENYENAIKFNPYLWQSYQNIAAIYFEQQQYDKSLEYIQKATQINPQNLNLKNNMGIVLLAMGDKQKAKEVFLFVLGIDPNNQVARAGVQEASK